MKESNIYNVDSQEKSSYKPCESEAKDEVQGSKSIGGMPWH